MQNKRKTKSNHVREYANINGEFVGKRAKSENMSVTYKRGERRKIEKSYYQKKGKWMQVIYELII